MKCNKCEEPCRELTVGGEKIMRCHGCGAVYHMIGGEWRTIIEALNLLFHEREMERKQFMEKRLKRMEEMRFPENE